MYPGDISVVVRPGRKQPVFMRRKSTAAAKPSSDPHNTAHLSKSIPPATGKSEPAKSSSSTALVTSSQATEQPVTNIKKHRAEKDINCKPSSVLASPGNSASRKIADLTADRQPMLLRSPDSLYKHVCGICGNYRSRDYHARHPLSPGEIPRPSICAPCASAQESSEGSNGNQDRSFRESNPFHTHQHSGNKSPHGSRSRCTPGIRSKNSPAGDEESSTTSEVPTSSPTPGSRPIPSAGSNETKEGDEDTLHFRSESSHNSVPTAFSIITVQEEPVKERGSAQCYYRSRSPSYSSEEFDARPRPSSFRRASVIQFHRGGDYRHETIKAFSPPQILSEKHPVFENADTEAKNRLPGNDYHSARQTSSAIVKRYTKHQFAKESTDQEEQHLAGRTQAKQQRQDQKGYDIVEVSPDPVVTTIRTLSRKTYRALPQGPREDFHSKNKSSWRHDSNPRYNDNVQPTNGPPRHRELLPRHCEDSPILRQQDRSRSGQHPPECYDAIDGRYERIEDPRVAGAREFIEDFVRKNTRKREEGAGRRRRMMEKVEYESYEW